VRDKLYSTVSYRHAKFGIGGLSECFKAQGTFDNKERYVATIIYILELISFLTLRFTSIYRYTCFHGQMLFK
jgi:hypothetical protein